MPTDVEMSVRAGPFDLGRLIAPVEVDAFSTSYWEREPLVVLRGDPSYYGELFSLEDADHVLAHSSIRPSEIRIVKDGRDIPVERLRSGSANRGEGGLEAVYQEYRGGSTLVLTFLHERWPSLRRLSQSLASELSAAVQVNVYITPPSSQGLGVHYDSHDVFVLQIAGSKHWRVFGSPTHLPLAEDRYDPANGQPSGPPRHDLVLHSGDMLYVPRGCLHAAASVDSFSIHLTLGIRTITWASVIRSAVESAFREESELRESLPLGFAAGDGPREEDEVRLRALVATVLEKVDAPDAIADAYQRARARRHPSLAGHLQDLDAVRTIDLETPLRIRPRLEFQLRSDAEGVDLEFHGKRMRLPPHAEEAARFVVGTPTAFTASDLPGPLDDDSALVLLRRMVREGLVTTASTIE